MGWWLGIKFSCVGYSQLIYTSVDEPNKLCVSGICTLTPLLVILILLLQMRLAKLNSCDINFLVAVVN